MSLVLAADCPAPAATTPASAAKWPLVGALVVLGLAAPVFALGGWLALTTHPAILFYSVPIVAAELAVVALAIAAGFDLRAAIARLAPATRVGAAVWLVAVALADLVFAADRALALPLMLTTAIHAVFGLALWAMFETAWARYRRWFLYSAGAGTILYGVVFIAIVANELGNPGFNWIGVGVGITNIRQLGFYGVALVAIAFGLSATMRSWPALCGAAGGAFGFWLAIVSGSRVAFAAALASVLVVGVLTPANARFRLAGLAAAALAVAIPASYLLVPHEAWGFDRIISRGLSGDSIDQYSSGRTAIWRETWAAIVDRPLFGHGEGQFRSQIAAAGGGLNHPHNAVLQFLYQWGIVGTAGLALMLSAGGLRLRRLTGHASGTDFAAFGTLAGLLAIAMFEGALYHAYPVMIAVLCLAVLNASAPPRDGMTRKTEPARRDRRQP